MMKGTEIRQNRPHQHIISFVYYAHSNGIHQGTLAFEAQLQLQSDLHAFLVERACALRDRGGRYRVREQNWKFLSATAEHSIVYSCRAGLAVGCPRTKSKEYLVEDDEDEEASVSLMCSTPTCP